MAVGSWGIAPSEFWRMTPAEFMWLVDAKTKSSQPAGGLDEAAYEELYDMLEDMG